MRGVVGDPAPTLGPAVTTTLAALDLPPSDAALAALVSAYAHEIDASHRRAERFERMLDRIDREDSPDAYEALIIARGLLSSRAALDKIGSRLQVGLDALRATPRARPMAPPRAPDASPLGRLRLAAGTEVDGARDGPPE